MLDVLIIGSGFGGSIAANRLTERGKEVTLLERGPWRDSAPVRALGIKERTPFPYGRHLFRYGLRAVHSGNGRFSGVTVSKRGYFEFFRTPGIDILCTSNVGGGSHAYTAMLTPPKGKGYWHDQHSSLRPQRVEQHYDRVLKDMGAVPMHEGGAVANSVWSHLRGAQYKRCAPSAEQPSLAMRLDHRRCDDGGVFGSPRGTKPSVDVVYLPAAMNNGLEVKDLCEVESIARVVDKGAASFRVRYRDHRQRNTAELRARVVVLAAGAINSLQLLFRSREQGGLLGMPALGQRFGGNGDYVGLWVRPDRSEDPFDATPSLGRFALDGADAPYMVMFGLPGVDALPLPKWFIKRIAAQIPVVGMGADSGHGTATYSNGTMRIRYDAASEAIFEDIRQVFTALQKESGKRIRYGNKAITVHQWGGAHLGPDELHGVVDHTGEVYGNSGLYIADGSALPRAAGTPPSLTIAAWAHHVAECVAEKEYGLRAPAAASLTEQKSRTARDSNRF